MIAVVVVIVGKEYFVTKKWQMWIRCLVDGNLSSKADSRLYGSKIYSFLIRLLKRSMEAKHENITLLNDDGDEQEEKEEEELKKESVT